MPVYVRLRSVSASAASAPWISATSSPAAGRETWVECGEDPAAPGEGGALRAPPALGVQGKAAGQAGALASAPDPRKAPPSQATEGPRQPPQRGARGRVPEEVLEKTATEGREEKWAERKFTLRVLGARWGRPGTPDVVPLMPLDLALGTCRDQNRPLVAGDSEIHKWSTGRQLSGLPKANMAQKSPSQWLWRRETVPYWGWGTCLPWPFLPHYLLRPQLPLTPPSHRCPLGVSW